MAAPGSQRLVPSPAEPSPGHLPGSWPGLRPRNPGPSPWTPKPCSGWKETQAGWSWDITLCKGIALVAPVSLRREGARIKKWRRGSDRLGDGWGSSEHWVLGSGLWAGSLQELGGVGSPSL